MNTITHGCVIAEIHLIKVSKLSKIIVFHNGFLILEPKTMNTRMIMLQCLGGQET